MFWSPLFFPICLLVWPFVSLSLPACPSVCLFVSSPVCIFVCPSVFNITEFQDRSVMTQSTAGNVLRLLRITSWIHNFFHVFMVGRSVFIRNITEKSYLQIFIKFSAYSGRDTRNCKFFHVRLDFSRELCAAEICAVGDLLHESNSSVGWCSKYKGCRMTPLLLQVCFCITSC